MKQWFSFAVCIPEGTLRFMNYTTLEAKYINICNIFKEHKNLPDEFAPMFRKQPTPLLK